MQGYVLNSNQAVGRPRGYLILTARCELDVFNWPAALAHGWRPRNESGKDQYCGDSDAETSVEKTRRSRQALA
jgi:hypothetical protein